MTKIRASKCIIKELKNIDTLDFLNENHYQGLVNAEVCYGLYYNDELVEVMTFGKPRYNKNYTWELLRLCTKKDYIVYGGASKLFNHFLSNNTGSVISYCNESKFNGKVYEVLGFRKRGSCKSYHYEKDGITYHRSNFTKKNCLKKWPEYAGKDITEKEIMQEKGYTRVEEIQATWTLGSKWYIYRTTNLINGKDYIGQHLDHGDEYWGSGTMLKRALKKYGKENFKKEILEDNILSQEEADKKELYYIKTAKLVGKAEYNEIDDRYTPHVRVITNGYIFSQRTRERMSEARKGKKPYVMTEEIKNKISEGLKGNTPWNKGLSCKPLSEEHKNKISEALKGIKRSEETKKKIGDWNKEHKEERGKAISKGKTKYIYTEITTGISHTMPEWRELGITRRRLSNANKFKKELK